jgi:hypothetical protein
VILLALGAVIVGVNLATVTETFRVIVLKLSVSSGVKVTSWEAVPPSGTVLGFVKVNVPGTLVVPPLSVELAKVCP